ncbi:hypothetical protein OUZ56_027681 [Daphnia magna]|uniref:Uncharacterized protein n=1 Tax=Daphnia magna TaxID=35525 RepID=A0ABR0B1L8_9CRUS|nr:hypothetical protein OUZ56_027681 [Daphnia magna]
MVKSPAVIEPLNWPQQQEQKKKAPVLRDNKRPMIEMIFVTEEEEKENLRGNIKNRGDFSDSVSATTGEPLVASPT